MNVAEKDTVCSGMFVQDLSRGNDRGKWFSSSKTRASIESSAKYAGIVLSNGNN